MAGGDVITKGASKRTVKKPSGGTRAGGDVITKGPTRKQSGKPSAKSKRVSARKKRRG